MIKEDIIRNLSFQQKIDREQSKEIVEEIITTLKDTLRKKENILISGFGSFKVNHKKMRIGRNPRTKEEYQISERNVVVFYPSKILRKSLNED